MNDDLVFYTHPMSRGRIARWMLEEVGHPYHTEPLDCGTTMRSPELPVAHPTSRVPTIRHGATLVTQSAPICAYLADAFPGAGLAPAGKNRLRSVYTKWLFFAAGPVEAAIIPKVLGGGVLAECERLAGYGTFAAMLDGLEAAVSSGDYLVGDRFSAADLYVGSQLGFGIQSGMIEKRPAFEAYWTRLSSRPSYQRALNFNSKSIQQAPPAG